MWTNESALTVCVWAIEWPALFPSEHPPLPKRTVIYGSWALRSCVLWCLIQGPTTRQGGERGCVGNSRGLRSSGTLISYKYSPCCSRWSLSLWLLRSYSMQGKYICLRPTPQKSVWCIKSLVCRTFLEVFLKHSHLIVVVVNSNQSPVLCAVSSNSNAFAGRPSVSSTSLSLPLTSTISFSLSHLLYLSFSLSLSPYWPLSEIYSSQEQLQRGAGVSNLWFNKTYISLAGVLYVPHPSPFGGFMEGLWIAGWFRSPLSCLWPVQATTHSPRRLAWPAKCSSERGLAGDVSAKETQTPQ